MNASFWSLAVGGVEKSFADWGISPDCRRELFSLAPDRFIFSVANPYGPPHPWILVAQILGAALVGGIGGLARPWLLYAPETPRSAGARVPILLACGLVATLLYDGLTNIAQGIAYRSFTVSIALGILPAVQHLASNLVIFALVGNFAVPWLRQHPMAARHAG